MHKEEKKIDKIVPQCGTLYGVGSISGPQQNNNEEINKSYQFSERKIYYIMDSKEFLVLRKKLEATQKQMAELLGVSLKAVHSYEQGWRSIPAHVERQVLFLLYLQNDKSEKLKSCWQVKKCPEQVKEQCPAWKFNAGKFCWFINGTICECKAQKDWREKMKICGSCKVFKDFLDRIS